MSFDQDDAFEVEQGLIIEGGAGTFSGSASPVGNQAPIGSQYKQTTNPPKWWIKFGSGINDWRITNFGDVDTNMVLSDLLCIVFTNDGQMVLHQE